MKAFAILASTALIVLFASSCQRETNSDVDISNPSAVKYNFILSFHSKVGDNDLLFNQPYLNTFGETYTITTFKYYIGTKMLDVRKFILVYNSKEFRTPYI